MVTQYLSLKFNFVKFNLQKLIFFIFLIRQDFLFFPIFRFAITNFHNKLHFLSKKLI